MPLRRARQRRSRRLSAVMHPVPRNLLCRLLSQDVSHVGLLSHAGAFLTSSQCYRANSSCFSIITLRWFTGHSQAELISYFQAVNIFQREFIEEMCVILIRSVSSRQTIIQQIALNHYTITKIR